MARTVRGGQLETRTARLKLAARGRPYWNSTAKQGLLLGYRRLANKNGTWVCATYRGKAGSYTTKAFAQADDFSDADGDEVLGYYEAAQKVAGQAAPVRHKGAYSVSDAVADYLAHFAKHRKSLKDAKSRLTAYVLPYFGDRQLSALTPSDLDAWSQWAYTHDPRADAPKRKKQDLSAAERERRRKSTMNKVITYLLSAFDRAHRQHRQGPVPSREAWAQLRKFKGVDNARISRLTTAEAKRLTNAAPQDFRRLLQVALLTGCRYGELARLRARDFDAGSGTLLVAESKSGKSRRVPLTAEGQQLLESLIADKAPDDIVLVKADGTPWASNDQFKRIREACTDAKIIPAVNFHAIRHTTASLLVEEGVPLAFVAEVLGHSDTRMVSKHYQHLAPSVVHDEVRAKMPNFGVTVNRKVRKLRP